jgi:L-lactate dehydrogenase complex protein LldG
VRRSTADEVAQVIADAVAARGAKRIGVPGGFPAPWSVLLPGPVPDDPPLDVAALDALDGVVTTCAVAIAETGTIVLDTGSGQGSRAFSLVPDYHLAVVRTGQIVAAVPDAVAALDPARPLTWISGPSATSDIELSRVEGVHGPRTLDIVIVAELRPPPAGDSAASPCARVSFPWNIRLSRTIRATGVARSFRQGRNFRANGALVSCGAGGTRRAGPARPAVRGHPPPAPPGRQHTRQATANRL